MATDWILTVDLRTDRSRLVLELGLFDRDRRHYWRTSRDIAGGMFRELVQLMGTVFAIDAGQVKRAAAMTQFERLAHGTFQLSPFLKLAGFADGDSLSIQTIVTAIPWDLLPYGDESLGLRVNVGLSIPTPRGSDPMRGKSDGRPRFLHIVANPHGDLHQAPREQREIEALVLGVGGLDYEVVRDPARADLIRALSMPRKIHFMHFTGHVVPRRGLQLQDGVFDAEEIVRYFPGVREQIVFLNGCDAVYGYEDGEGPEREPNLFQAASIANAFLDAGTDAVIAPRSHVSDDHACRAAAIVWKGILEGEGIAATVRHLRRELSAQEPGALSSYSYVLYGNPSARVRRTRDVRGVASAPATPSSQHPLVIAAAADAADAVAPRHLFSMLTRRWIVGQIYFALDRQRYILALEQLRTRLGIATLPGAARAGAVDLTPAGHLVLQQALARADTRELDELTLLEALADVGDPEVTGALEEVGLGPRRLDAVVRQARQWIAADRPIPVAAVLPSGLLNAQAFLVNEHLVGGPDEHPGGDGRAAPSDVTPWDLFFALAGAGEQMSALFGGLETRASTETRWTAGMPLYWMQMSPTARDITSQAIAAMESEHGPSVHEGHLAYALASSDALQWSLAPEAVRRTLLAAGLTEQTWGTLLESIRLKSLTWT